MDIAIYERIWENSIKPKINRMLTSDPDIFFVGEHIKDTIWRTYEDYKNKVHTYMHNPDGRIDRHKVASVMLYSIIVNRPIEIKYLLTNQKASGSALLANEILGFNTALAIVWSFILTDANQQSDKIKIDIFKEGFIFPPSQHGRYEDHVYKMLYYSRFNKFYDIFALANILFLVEAYTEFVRKTELIGKVQST